MRDMAFGQYYPTNSPLHRLDPRAKLIFSLLYMVFIFFAKSYTAFFYVCIFLTIVTIVAKIPLKIVLKSIKLIIFLLIFTGFINLFLYDEGNVLASWWIFTITDRGIDFTIKLALRLSLLVIGTSMLSLTTTPMELTDAIESLLKPLKYIKVPVHDIAITMSIALRFVPTLMEETDKIIAAQKARGAAFDTGKVHERVKSMVPILIPLFVSSFRRADELADALDARCYNATQNRTKMKKLSFSYRDLIAFFIFSVLIVLIMLDCYLTKAPAESILFGTDYYIFNLFKSWIG